METSKIYHHHILSYLGMTITMMQVGMIIIQLFALASYIPSVQSFSSLTNNRHHPSTCKNILCTPPLPPLTFISFQPLFHRSSLTCLFSSEAEPESKEESKEEGESSSSNFTPEETEKVGNLVADDEWAGLSMELAELVRVAVVEDIKKNTRDFIGKDDYKVGDISKEIDSRVKDEVALLRGKEEYELGDLTMALDEISKDLTCELTGKDEYEFGDLSVEIDKRIKEKVADFCGKDEYEFGDLSIEIDKRVKDRVKEFTGKEGEYEFGDISREINNRRKAWVADFLGKEAAENYEFGDITKKAISNFTGKENYEFGDVTKKILGGVFGKRKKGGSEGADDAKADK